MQSGNSAFQIIGSVTEILKTLKETAGALPVNSTILPSMRGNMIQLQQQVNELERTINAGFPKLAQLVRSYSNLLSEVRGAKVFSDKLSELYSLAPNISQYNSLFSNSLQSDYTRISRILEQFTSLDVSEKGSIDRILFEIRDQLQNLQRFDPSQQDRLKEVLQKISTQYSDMEGILSKLLEKILKDFEIGNR